MIVDSARLATLLQRVGVETLLAELADRIEADFASWPRFEKSAGLAVPSRVGVLELMPADVDERVSGTRVNGHPGKLAKGLLTVTAIGMLADVATGQPRPISQLTIPTALSTAATSAFAARRLADRGARTLAVIGTGAHGEFRAPAGRAWPGNRRIQYHDTAGLGADAAPIPALREPRDRYGSVLGLAGR
jgi:ornithine cyclodeaminase